MKKEYEDLHKTLVELVDKLGIDEVNNIILQECARAMRDKLGDLK